MRRTSSRLALFLTLALPGISSLTAAAEMISVCAEGCDHTSINAAIATARDGDVIQLSAETYAEGSVISTDGKAITLRGVLDERGAPASVLDGAGSHRVLICEHGEDSGTVFENLVIRNGENDIGGGMYNDFSSPTLTNCTFTGNTAGDDGGGMSNHVGSPMLTDCTFMNNSSIFSGGGMHNEFSHPILIRCTFADNSADNEYG
ncbi:MAG: hypothetical protein CMJ54_05705, partial [Planctomycetaceae bacterium]|nr:hypothetical protein [Planctomycetaceae bacterium]